MTLSFEQYASWCLSRGQSHTPEVGYESFSGYATIPAEAPETCPITIRTPDSGDVFIPRSTR